MGGPKGEQQMSTVDLPLQTLLGYLQKLAEQSLSFWDVPEDAGSLVEVAFMITRQLVNCPRVDHKFLVLVKHNYIFFSSPFVMRSDESSIGLGDPTCRADELQETIAIRRVEQ